jgi:transposase
MAKPTRRYSESFKQQAVELYLSLAEIRTLKEVAAELGVHPNVLRRWVSKAANEDQRPVGESERAELMRLRKENRVLKEELEILKKAAAFFARDRSRT